MMIIRSLEQRRELLMNSKQLRKLLNKHERSQRYLARQLNVSYQSMYKWMNDLMPISADRVAQIKEILK